MSAVDILAYATKCGLTAADLKTLSPGFVIDLCAARVELEADEGGGEEKFMLMRRNLGAVQSAYESGKISEERYGEYMEKYRRMGEKYGFEVDD